MKMPKLSMDGVSSSPYVAALAYAALIVVLIATVMLSAKGVLDRRTEVEGLGEILARLEGRRASTVRGITAADDPATSGSYVLQGATVTIAGAALLQRVVSSVTKFGGSVLSSQVDLGTQVKDGVINVIASCDMEQTALQQVVYDIEAGMPFLFVEQLVVQAPATSTGSGSGKLRVLLSVSGQWQGTR